MAGRRSLVERLYGGQEVDDVTLMEEVANMSLADLTETLRKLRMTYNGKKSWLTRAQNTAQNTIEIHMKLLEANKRSAIKPKRWAETAVSLRKAEQEIARRMQNLEDTMNAMTRLIQLAPAQGMEEAQQHINQLAKEITDADSKNTSLKITIQDYIVECDKHYEEEDDPMATQYPAQEETGIGAGTEAAAAASAAATAAVMARDEMAANKTPVCRPNAELKPTTELDKGMTSKQINDWFEKYTNFFTSSNMEFANPQEQRMYLKKLVSTQVWDKFQTLDIDKGRALNPLDTDPDGILSQLKQALAYRDPIWNRRKEYFYLRQGTTPDGDDEPWSTFKVKHINGWNDMGLPQCAPPCNTSSTCPIETLRTAFLYMSVTKDDWRDILTKIPPSEMTWKRIDDEFTKHEEYLDAKKRDSEFLKSDPIVVNTVSNVNSVSPISKCILDGYEVKSPKHAYCKACFYDLVKHDGKSGHILRLKCTKCRTTGNHDTSVCNGKPKSHKQYDQGTQRRSNKKSGYVDSRGYYRRGSYDDRRGRRDQSRGSRSGSRNRYERSGSRGRDSRRSREHSRERSSSRSSYKKGEKSPYSKRHPNFNHIEDDPAHKSFSVEYINLESDADDEDALHIVDSQVESSREFKNAACWTQRLFWIVRNQVFKTKSRVMHCMKRANVPNSFSRLLTTTRDAAFTDAPVSGGAVYLEGRSRSGDACPVDEDVCKSAPAACQHDDINTFEDGYIHQLADQNLDDDLIRRVPSLYTMTVTVGDAQAEEAGLTKLKRVKTDACADSGAFRTICGYDIARSLGIDYKGTKEDNIHIRAAGGNVLAYEGSADIMVQFQGRQIYTKALVTKAIKNKLIVGQGDLIAIGVLPTGFPNIICDPCHKKDPK